MVDKIDKPEAPSPYAITAATEPKKDRQHEERKPAEEIARYQKGSEAKAFGRLMGEIAGVKTLRVPLEEIQQLLFRRAIPRQGNPVVEAKLIWKNNQVTEIVIFLLSHREDFLKIRSLRPGDSIPEIFWRQGPHLEIGIPQSTSASGSWSYQQLEKEELHEAKVIPTGQQIFSALGWIDKTSGEWRPGVIALQLFLMGIAIVLIARIAGGS